MRAAVLAIMPAATLTFVGATAIPASAATYKWTYSAEKPIPYGTAQADVQWQDSRNAKKAAVTRPHRCGLWNWSSGLVSIKKAEYGIAGHKPFKSVTTNTTIGPGTSGSFDCSALNTWEANDSKHKSPYVNITVRVSDGKKAWNVVFTVYRNGNH